MRRTICYIQLRIDERTTYSVGWRWLEAAIHIPPLRQDSFANIPTSSISCSHHLFGIVGSVGRRKQKPRRALLPFRLVVPRRFFDTRAFLGGFRNQNLVAFVSYSTRSNRRGGSSIGGCDNLPAIQRLRRRVWMKGRVGIFGHQGLFFLQVGRLLVDFPRR
jgi:hypothetical protein